MNKPQMCLALSLTISFGQSAWLTVSAAPAGTIWQKMSGSSSNISAPAPVQKPKAIKKVATQTSASPVVADGHAMLFLPGRKDAGLSGAAPAAALTIHPALPDSVAEVAAAGAPAIEEKPELIAAQPSERTSEIPSGEEIMSASAPQTGGSTNQLLAQLAPDRVIAQATDSATGITATPIPPVVTGTVDLEEFKPTNVIELKVSQSRTFKMKNKIVRTSISDPGIAEPVVVAENQMVLLGKSPGTCTMLLWDDAGNSVALDLRVTRDYGQLQATLREIDPRIIVKAFSVGGGDRVLLLGDVDHPESVIRAFAASNVFMDDRGFNIQVANNRLTNARIGEVGAAGGGGAGGGGGGAGALSQIGSVDRYTFFPNVNNNISKAQLISSDGGRVTSLVKVRKVPLIVLHVTFMEMNTSAARSLGVQLGINVSGYGFGFGIGGNNLQGGQLQSPQYLLSSPGITQQLPTFGAGTGALGLAPQVLVPGASATSPLTFTTPPPSTVTQQFAAPSTGAVSFQSLSSVLGQAISGIGLAQFPVVPALIQQAVLLGAPGGATFQPGGLSNLFTGVNNWSLGNRTRASFTPSVQGIVSHSRARVLSEPTLVTISGERASFLAGGEIPILQSVATAGQAQQSVTFEPFGMRINMIPVLMENGGINLQISPEERIISNAIVLNIPGSNTNIPGFTTRKCQTIVEMKPGQELFISGLVSTNNGRELNKVPIIGEIPVFGSLYRSKAFSKNESELVIAVRPEVILPGTPGQLKLPEEIGRVEGPRDMNLFQVEPTVMDERHYTSGRAERHQKTSPTLPEGAPIPDNE